MPNRNASHVAFGWQFQINAGIVIMLDYIREAVAVKIEGNKEDIEIILENGTKIFAQAKGTTSPDESKNAMRDLKKALETLGEAGKARNVKRLIFVTNRTNPLNDVSTLRKFSNSYSLVPYQQLTKKWQNSIKDICAQKGLDLPTELFSILALEFPDNEESRYETIQERVSTFLVEIDGTFQGFAKKMLEKWQQQFWQNASQKDCRKAIKKKDMIWPLIVLFCEDVDDPMLDDFDTADQEIIEERFADIISDHSERFELVTKIMSEYTKFKASHSDKVGAVVEKSFIEEKEALFRDEFALDGEEVSIAQAVRKITIRKILRQRRRIDEVKEAVNL
jgi:hypothetical protein